METQTTIVLPDAPAFPERCDVEAKSVIAAVVAFNVRFSNGEIKRMTYCAHHWDTRPAVLNEMVVGVVDLRDFGLFAEEKPE